MSQCKKKCVNKEDKTKKCITGKWKSSASCCAIAIVIVLVTALAVIYFGALNDGLLAVLVAAIAILVLC